MPAPHPDDSVRLGFQGPPVHQGPDHCGAFNGLYLSFHLVVSLPPFSLMACPYSPVPPTTLPLCFDSLGGPLFVGGQCCFLPSGAD